MTTQDQGGCWGTPSIWQGQTLLAARLRLRPLTDADAAPMADMLADGQVARLTRRIPHPYDPGQAADFIARMAQARNAGTALALGLERLVDGRLAGVIGLDDVHTPTPELGYWLGRDHWGQGLMAEAVRRLLRHLFGDLGIDQIRAETHPDNAASAAVLRKAGFRGGANHDFIHDRQSWAVSHAARPKILVAAAALVDVDGRVLMATRPPGKSMAGLWEFPGGKLEAGETPEQALIRELAEELGISVAESCLAPLAFASHDYDTFHLLMPLYAIRQWQGQPQAHEGQGLKWVRPNDMSRLPMPPADIPLAAMLRDWV